MLKQTLIALMIGSSMSACAAHQTTAFPDVKTINSPTQLQTDDKVITLEKIMSHEDWISFVQDQNPSRIIGLERELTSEEAVGLRTAGFT